MLADATLTVTGAQGFLIVLAALLFLLGAVAAYFAAHIPRPVWAVCLCAGLLFWVLTYLVH